MMHYSLERKESALHKMMPPSSMSIAKLSLDMGIGESTLYNWLKQAMNPIFRTYFKNKFFGIHRQDS
jgi:transposase-like protein